MPVDVFHGFQAPLYIAVSSDTHTHTHVHVIIHGEEGSVQSDGDFMASDLSRLSRIGISHVELQTTLDTFKHNS